jgi:cysteine sulfinate desulfinase/cysteine desulfurase-like protein
LSAGQVPLRRSVSFLQSKIQNRQSKMPYLTTHWGNPSSAYKFGAKLNSVIETAREQVAAQDSDK